MHDIVKAIWWTIKFWKEQNKGAKDKKILTHLR